MHISKLDLYKSEWLDLVFDQRNKAYGAYELRQHYGNTMSKAMGATFLSLAAVIAVGFVLHKPAAPVEIITDHGLISIMPPPPKVVQPKHEIIPPKAISKPAAPVNVIKFPPLVVTPDPIAQDPPKVDEIKGAVGPVEVKNAKAGDAINMAIPNGPGDGVPPAPAATEVVDATAGGLEFMPEPVGGAAAWQKFLQRNIRYPAAASEQGTMGKVWLSFIIERDGKLSNIEVIRPAGSGFDEEALRVLKLAPAWRPGKQNGQAVRVRYSIPINFTISE